MRRQDGHLHAPGSEKGIIADEKTIGLLTRKRCEGSIDFTTGAGLPRLSLKSHSASSGYYVPQRGLGSRRIGRIDEYGHSNDLRNQLTQEFQPFRYQLTTKKIDTGQITSRFRNARDKAQPDRVFW